MYERGREKCGREKRGRERRGAYERAPHARGEAAPQTQKGKKARLFAFLYRGRKTNEGRMRFGVHPLFVAYGAFAALRGQLIPFIAATVCAVMHECGHAWYAARIGRRLERLCLLPSGAIVTGDIEGISLADEVRLALAGPAVNFVSALLFAALWWLWPETYPYTEAAAAASASLFAVNLLPALPLDGGRVLLCLIAKRRGEAAASRILKGVGAALAAVLAALFAAGCFAGKVNFSLLFFAAFVLGGSFGGKDCRYTRIRYDWRQNLSRGMPVRRVALSQRCTVRQALGYFERGTWLEISLFDDAGKHVATLSQRQICELFSSADIYRPLKDYITGG